MKIGVRKPNVKNRVKSRTTGRAKRAVKKSVNPLYGKKGMGYVKDEGSYDDRGKNKRTAIGN